MGHMSFVAFEQKERSQASKVFSRFPATNKRSFSSTGSFSCDYCHMPGHTREKCYRLNGFPLGYGSGKGYKSEGTKIAVVAHGDTKIEEEFSKDDQDSAPISIS